MTDLDAAVLDASLLFASRRLDALLQQVGSGPDAFLAALLGRPPSPAETAAIAPVRADVQGHLSTVGVHAAALASRLAAPPAKVADVGAPAADLATALTELAAAVTAVGGRLGGGITAASGMEALLTRAVARVSESFGGLGQQLGLVDDAVGVSSGLHVAGTVVTLKTENAQSRVIEPPIPLALHDSTFTGVFDWTAPSSLTLKLKTGLRAGLVADGFLQKLMPAATSVDGTIDVQDDASSGFTLGAGSRRRLTIPAHLEVLGIELRDLALELPDQGALSDGSDPPVIALVASLKGAVGPVTAVVDGFGIALLLDAAEVAAGSPNPTSVAAQPPSGAGLSINAGVVKGGGYLSVKHGVYGGALDLAIGPIEIKAVGLITPDPFSLVLVLSVEFHPGIQLSFGFTLNGVGGLIAIERTVSTDAFRRGLHDHTIDSLLFPSDPVGSAPKILDALAADFPRQQGGFVVGPMVELGWGTPVSYVTAKVGIIISLPDPKVILLGVVRVALPTPDAAIVDIRAEIYGEITPQHILFLVSLQGSIAGFTLSGDLGVLIGFGDNPEFALSAGGFHPHYKPPGELTGMRRLAVDLSPPALLTLRTEGYFALTSNSVQLGALVQLRADVGVAGAEGHLSFDALVRFDPFAFEIDLAAGISLYVFGTSFGGVALALHLEGPGLWLAHGTASVSFLFFDFDFEVGPLTWGEGDNPPADSVSPVQLVVDALQKPASWRSFAPDDGDRVARLIDADVGTAVLVHPLGAFEVRQHAVPLDTTIDRVGRHPVSEKRVTLGAPTIGGLQAKAVSYATDLFAPGQFLDLTNDQKLSRPAFEPFPSGMKLNGTSGDTHGHPVESVYRWETVYPGEEQLESRLHDVLLDVTLLQTIVQTGPAGVTRRISAPYAVATDPVRLSDAGQVVIRKVSDLTTAEDAPPGPHTTTEAMRVLEDLGSRDLQIVGMGVAS